MFTSRPQRLATIIRAAHSPQLLGKLSIWLGVLGLLTGTTASAQRAFTSRYSNTVVRGDIVLIGNVNYHCSSIIPPATRSTAANCVTARAGGSVTNNNVAMVPIDTDSNSATTNSSSATLNLPAGSTVLFAGLYWSGSSTLPKSTYAQVFFAPPGGAGSTLTSSAVSSIGNNYQSFIDVTSQVQTAGTGSYTIGNISSGNTGSSTSSGNWGGWTLVVAYRNSTLSNKNLTVFDGFQLANNPANPVDITVSGFLTPSTGTVKSTIGVVAYDGDRGQSEGAEVTPNGSLRFGPTTSSLNTVSNAVNPVNDVFNSTISALGSDVTAGRNPAFTNTLGLDIDTFTPNTPLPNSSTSAVVRVIGTSGDVIYPGVITLATEIYVPNIKDALTKTVTDINGGALVPGDVLQYELVINNQGDDGATNIVLTDPLPANTTFVPGSLEITDINAGNKTDVAGDDQAEYDSVSNKVVARLGTGATAAAGGILLPTQQTKLRFKVTVNAGTPGGTVIDNSGQVAYNQQTLGTAVVDTSDSDPITPGDQPARIVVSGPDLTIDKSHTGNFVPGQPGTFTLHVSNIGLASSIGAVTVTDTLPTGLSAQAISGTGWNCVLTTLTCTRSDALAKDQAYPDITLTVNVAAGSTGTVTNTATVSGGGQASNLTGNDTDSDAVNIVATLPPAVSLTKTVRNVTRNGTEVTVNTAEPDDTLEYCIQYQNTGGKALSFHLIDTASDKTVTLPNAYGTDLALKYITASNTTLLSAAIDSDAGQMVGQDIALALPSLGAGESGKVCFQAKVK